MRRVVRTVFAFFLLVIGAVFVVTPFIPGWPIMVIGLSLLAPDYAWARRWLEKMRNMRRRRASRASPSGDATARASAPSPKV